jgi:hypothetical protein
MRKKPQRPREPNAEARNSDQLRPLTLLARLLARTAARAGMSTTKSKAAVPLPEEHLPTKGETGDVEECGPLRSQ